MVRIISLHGQPVDPQEYERYYRDVHIPIVRRIPGVRNIRFGRVVQTADGSSPPYYLVSDVYFDNMDALKEALSSPEMEEAMADVPNFASGGVTIMFGESEDVSP
jgi:uncharacterized protein (TIGR02118 family)